MIVKENSDKSIDGEILVNVPRGVDPQDVIIEIQDAILDRSQPFPRGSYFNFGLRFPPSAGEEEKYPMTGGLANVFIPYYSTNDIGHGATIAMLIEQGLKDTYHRKTREIIFRVHWNRYGERPPKDET